jgi:hypothetical protein
MGDMGRTLRPKGMAPPDYGKLEKPYLLWILYCVFCCGFVANEEYLDHFHLEDLDLYA